MVGAQCIDRTWFSLKAFLGQKLLLKHQSKPINEEAKKHVRIYAFRANFLALHGPDVLKPKVFFLHSSRKWSDGGLKTTQNYFLPVRLNPTIFKRNFCTMQETLAGVGKTGCATNPEL